MVPNLVKVMTIALLLIAPSSVRAVVVPGELKLGDTYHLVFLTKEKQNAFSTSIGTYNIFVQSQAAQNSILTGPDLGVYWFVRGTTLNDDARGNAVVSAPVYLLDGSTKVADGFDDIWDGEIYFPINVDQFGSIVGSPDTIFTGSNSDGTTHFDGVQRFLGSTSNVALGDPTATNSNWISSAFTSVWSDERSFYALSEELTVVPEPAAGSLVASGLLIVFWRRRRLRRDRA
jgi:hypothetical protein